MIAKNEIELCILLAYTGCAERNTKGLIYNISCGHDWTFKCQHLHLSDNQVNTLIYN